MVRITQPYQGGAGCVSNDADTNYEPPNSTERAARRKKLAGEVRLGYLKKNASNEGITSKRNIKRDKFGSYDRQI